MNRTVARTAATSALALALAGAGCTDALTYSQDARQQGLDLYQKSEYVDATGAFRSAVQQDPQDYRSYYYLAACYQARGLYPQATTSYRTCLDLIPTTLAGRNDLPAWYAARDGLATSIAKGPTYAAETAAIEKRSAGKGSVEDQWLLGKIYRAAGDADAAVEAYNKAVRIDPTRFDVLKEAGLYEFGLKQNDLAAFTLKKAYAVDPADNEVNAALRQLGVVIGPSLNDPRSLSHV